MAEIPYDIFKKLVETPNTPSDDQKGDKNILQKIKPTIDSISIYVKKLKKDIEDKNISEKIESTKKAATNKERQLNETRNFLKKKLNNIKNVIKRNKESGKTEIDKIQKNLEKITGLEKLGGGFLEKADSVLKSLKLKKESDLLITYNEKVKNDIGKVNKSNEKTFQNIRKVTRSIDVSQIKDAKDSYISMVKEYGKEFFDATIGRTFKWLTSESQDITNMLSWVKKKGMSVFKWFKTTALNPLQGLYELTTNLAKIGFGAIKTVYTVLAWPVKKAMNYLVKVLKTILFNPIIFIPLTLALGVVGYKFVKLFAPIISDVIGAAWKRVKTIIKEWLPTISKHFFLVWNTIVDWLSDAFLWVFSEKHAQDVKHILEKYLGINFTDIKDFVAGYYNTVMQFIQYDMWDLIKLGAFKAVEHGWNYLLGILGLKSKLSEPAKGEGVVAEKESEVKELEKELNVVQKDAEDTLESEIDKGEKKLDEGLKNESDNFEKDVELEATKKIKEENEQLVAEQEQKASDIVQKGKGYTNQIQSDFIEEGEKIVNPEEEKIKKVINAAKKQQEINKKLKDAYGTGKKINKAEMGKIQEQKETIEKSVKNVETKKSSEQTQMEQNLKPPKNISTVKDSGNGNIPNANVEKIEMISSTERRRLTSSDVYKKIFKSIESKKFTDLSALTGQLRNTRMGSPERKESLKKIRNIRSEIKQMAEIGMDYDEMVAYLEEMAPHYKIMGDLLSYSENIRTIENNMKNMSSEEKQRMAGILNKHKDRFNELNDSIQNYTISGSNETYDSLGLNDITVSGDNINIKNNWIKDPIFTKLMAGINPNNVKTKRKMDIPEAEKGGIVTSSTLAVIGEGLASEIVLPINKFGVEFITEAIDNVIKDNRVSDSPLNNAENQTMNTRKQIKRIIKGVQPKADQTIYDMKLISSSKLGVS